ncbi:hypothetical protein LINGRAHAP2_LOCUS30714 [Linum grandiflorum]
MFGMHPYKFSGLDGFTPSFYQKMWADIGGMVATMCREWLEKKERPSGTADDDYCFTSKSGASGGNDQASPNLFVQHPISLGGKSASQPVTVHLTSTRWSQAVVIYSRHEHF